MGYSVALIILYDFEKKFLLQHRSQNAKVLPGYWAFFGGEIKRGETPEKAVRREAFEELNYRIRSPELVIEQDFTEGDVFGHIYVYIEALNQDRSSLRLKEGQGWGWYNQKQMQGLKMTERDKQIISFIVCYLEEQKELGKVKINEKAILREKT